MHLVFKVLKKVLSFTLWKNKLNAKALIIWFLRSLFLKDLFLSVLSNSSWCFCVFLYSTSSLEDSKPPAADLFSPKQCQLLSQ